MAQAPTLQDALDVLVQRIVAEVHPRQVVLFGSSARGDATDASDLDILVVMPDGVHRRRTAQRIHRCLMGLGRAKDIVVATESDVRDHGDNPSLVLQPALREGRGLYAAGQ